MHHETAIQLVRVAEFWQTDVHDYRDNIFHDVYHCSFWFVFFSFFVFACNFYLECCSYLGEQTTKSRTIGTRG